MRPSYRFDDIELDLEAFRLTRAGDPIRLEPKVLELLGYLVQNRGRLVEKPELQQAIWSDTAVSESALTRAVAQLRKALDDDAREARYVETVPTRGYRFRPEVSVEEGRLRSDAGNGPEPGGFDRRPPGPSGSPGKSVGLVAAAVLTAALVAVLAWRARNPVASGPATRGREIQRTQVSTTRGFNAFPSFSPDGSAVAFSSDRSGRLEIYVRPLAPGARETPITSDGQDNVQPAWSPDGRFIAYHSLRRGGLWLVPALGGVPRQIAEFGSAPTWSPDGQKIVFCSLGLVAFEGFAQYGASLFVLDLTPEGLAPARRLTEPGQPALGHGLPRFSPDGASVYFIADGVWAVPRDGGRPRQVVDTWASDVAFSPDGRTLYWSAFARGSWHVWSAPVPPAGELVRERHEVVATGDQAACYLAMSRDGRLAAGLTVLTSELAFVSLTPDGSAAGPPSEPLAMLSGRKANLHFSPDGQTLAFGRVQSGQDVEVWGVDRTGAPRQLLPGATLNFLNGWFPDGKSLFVTSRLTKAGPRSLARAPLDGGPQRPLAQLEGMGWARLLPSGREMVYHGFEGGALNVWRSSLDGAGARALTHDEQAVGWPVPSPDGSTLMVEMFRGTDVQIGLMPADGSAPPRALTHLAGQHWGHDWSPDGRRVLYGARRDGLWNVYWMNVETGEERRLTDHARVRDSVRTPAWSPKGDRIAYERMEVTSGVWVFDLETPPPR